MHFAINCKITPQASSTIKLNVAFYVITVYLLPVGALLNQLESVQSNTIDGDESVNSVEFSSYQTSTAHIDNHHHSNKQHYHASCGTIASNNHTRIILKNPHHPEPTYAKAICETVIERSNESVKALIITFKELELYRSNYDGTCVHDRFAVYTDLNAAVTPIMCGSQTGKNISVPFEMPHKSLVVSITTSDLDHDRIWHLEIEQSTESVNRKII